METIQERTTEPLQHTGTDKVEAHDPKRVFIVYGRNTKAYDAMRLFIQSLKLDPLTFDEVKNDLGGSPFVGDIVRSGMTKAEAIVVLFTPDEYARLHPSLSSTHDTKDDTARWQPRPNVLLEAGMALALDDSRTILAVLGRDVALASDLQGRHFLRLSNDPKSRDRLRDALVGAGCSVGHTVTDYHDLGVAGDFESCVSSSELPEAHPTSPAVELCCYCREEIDPAKDKFVVLAEANKAKGIIRSIAHPKCAKDPGGQSGIPPSEW